MKSDKASTPLQPAPLSSEHEIEQENVQLITDRRSFMAMAGFGIGAAALTLSSEQTNAEPTVKIQQPQPSTNNDALSLDDIKGAERVMDLNFTSERRQDILDNIEGTRRAVTAVREHTLENGLAPAPAFDPRLPGKTYTPQKNALITSKPLNHLPASEEDIAFASVVDQAQWIKSKHISSLELTEIYLKRISKYAANLQCFITVTADLARKQAKAADSALALGQYLGPLHGIPYALKDLADTKGILTTWGAEPFKNRIATTDATLVTKLREAGAVLIGKATSGALAIGDVWFGGITRNPWNVYEGSSGSSAGPASSTAAGLCSFSIGTETLGSIISPANRCGLAGLRPTFGRVSRKGFMALSWSLDKVGPLCRYSEDTAIILSIINGHDLGDVSSIDHGFTYNGLEKLSDLRIGYMPKAFDSSNITKTDKDALLAAKELGINLKEVSLPDLPYSGMSPIIRAESSAAFDDLIRSNEIDTLKRKGPSARASSLRVVRMLSAVDYINMERLRRQAMMAMHELFSDVDVIIGPNYAESMLFVTNYTGQPQISFRAGFQNQKSRPLNGQESNPNNQEYKVPQNFSSFAPLFGEGPMIRVAKAIESELGAVTHRPTL
jgi:Asp-tRNA(Asn)/Glu-tRNA(Gln) amidotransferase A subunit family amidase